MTDAASALRVAVDAFIEFLRVERQLSAHTRENYRRHLGEACRLLHEEGLDDWSRLSAAAVRRLVVRLHRHGQQAPRSIATKMSALRSFADYLVRQGVLPANPARGISTPKQGRPLPKNLDVDQVYQLLNLPSSEEPLVIRDRAIMELFYSSGLRLSELVALNVDDLSRHDRQLRVIGKGNKERVVPVGRLAIEWLDKWLQVRPQLVSGEEPALFVSLQKRRLCSRTIQQRLASWGTRQQLAAHVHPHKLRHSFATHLLEGGASIAVVRELLGHESMLTTQRYLAVSGEHLRVSYQAAHPRAKGEDEHV